MRVPGENGLPTAAWREVPRGVWALGLGSLCMDTSSELVHGLLPAFMTMVLGAPMMVVGLVEGIAEGTAAVTRVFSGALSDRLGRRKPVVVCGYGLAALTKPVFPLATSVAWVLGARFLDRVGKGIRGAPRDALVADLTPPPLRGAAYGLRQALDSVGAVLGPLLAVGLMWLWADDITAVLWAAVPPAVLAVAVIGAFVREPAPRPPSGRLLVPVSVRDARALPGRYWLVVLFASVVTLARFSEAFLVLRAQDVGLPLGGLPLVLVVMNVAYATLAYPAGAAADRLGRRPVLLAGLVVLVAADVILAMAATPAVALLGAAAWGVHMAMTQGLLAALVAETAPAALRGTAFGIFHLLTGGALLLASLLAGALWQAVGAPATFVAGAVFSTVAAAGLAGERRLRR